jgi:hypothetical protein
VPTTGCNHAHAVSIIAVWLGVHTLCQYPCTRVFSPGVAEGDGCVEYSVAGTQALAELPQVLLQLHHPNLSQPTVGDRMGQHQDAEVWGVGAGNLQHPGVEGGGQETQGKNISVLLKLCQPTTLSTKSNGASCQSKEHKRHVQYHSSISTTNTADPINRHCLGVSHKALTSCCSLLQ